MHKPIKKNLLDLYPVHKYPNMVMLSMKSADVGTYLKLCCGLTRLTDTTNYLTLACGSQNAIS